MTQKTKTFSLTFRTFHACVFIQTSRKVATIQLRGMSTRRAPCQTVSSDLASLRCVIKNSYQEADAPGMELKSGALRVLTKAQGIH